MSATVLQIVALAMGTSVAPAAMVLSSSGNFVVERPAEKTERLKAMDLLRPGDRLRVPEEGKALLLILADGHKEQLKPGTRTSMTEKGCTPAEGVERVQERPVPAGALGA